MKEKLTPRRWIAILTSLLFTAYATYHIFIIFRDMRALTSTQIFICSLVAALFLVLAAFVWTGGIHTKNVLFLIIRRTAFIIALLVIFVLKARMAGAVVEYLEDSPSFIYTVLYGGAYFMTLTAILVLLIYYVFFRKRLLLFPWSSMVLPIAAMILFSLSLIFEAIMFFAYDTKIEANTIRTVVMRPVFYFGFIGLSVYFFRQSC